MNQMGRNMDHTDSVAQAKADLLAAGYDLSGPCGAFAIVNLTAWRLRSEGAGLLSKPVGNNCDGYAPDIVAYRNGQIFDVLIDGGGENGPTWQDTGIIDDVTRWRPAIDPQIDQPVEPPTLDSMQQLQRRIEQLEAKTQFDRADLHVLRVEVAALAFKIIDLQSKIPTGCQASVKVFGITFKVPCSLTYR